MPPTILNVVLGHGESLANLKHEPYYGDYEGEVTALESGGPGTSTSIQAIKDEPVRFSF